MKNKFKILLRTGILGILIVLLVCSLNSFFQPRWVDFNNYYTVKGIYSDPKNRIETVFLGSSVMINIANPIELYNDYGICSYNLATQEQPVFASYYLLEEAYRLNKETLKTVVFDVSQLRDEGKNQMMHKALDELPFSYVKLKAAFDFSDGDIGGAIDFLLPLTSYHSRWTEIDATEFDKFSLEAVNGTRGYLYIPYTYFSTTETISELKFNSTILNEFAQPAELIEESLNYFNKMISFCKEKNLELILIKTPTLIWDSSLHNAVKIIADENQLEFIDFNFSPYIDEIKYLIPFDSYEGTHLNYYGGKKITSWIGKYLAENCGATDIRNDEKYEYMKENARLYDEHTYKKAELIECEDPAEYLTIALEGNNTVFVTVKDAAAKSLTDEQRKTFADLGLTALSELNGRDSYIAVVNNNEVVYENVRKAEDADSNDPITYEGVLADGTKYTLQSGGHLAGNISSCIIGENEESENIRGLNFVVYNNELSSVLAKKAFDTYSSSTRSCYRYEFTSLLSDEAAVEELKDHPVFKKVLDYCELQKVKNEESKISYISENNDIFSLIDIYAEDSDNILFFSVKDEASTRLDDKDRELFGSLGLNGLNNLGFRDTYLAVMENKTVTYENKASSKESLVYENDNYRIESSGFDANNVSSVVINETEYSINARGINVVIYNKTTEEVIKSITFDTYGKDIKSSAK